MKSKPITFFIVLCLLLACVTFPSCTKPVEKFSAHAFDYFDTVTTVTGYAESKDAFDEVAEHRLTKPMRGHFAKSGVKPSRTLRELRLVEPASVEVGQSLTVEMFAAGDKIKVTGTSIGKGYQGVMRRWNFRGIKDGHGNEKVHRSGGSIGNNTFPGHVFKGKKMAGQWGAERVTQLGLEIVEVRAEDNVILVKGSVPGPRNGLVLVRKQ